MLEAVVISMDAALTQLTPDFFVCWLIFEAIFVHFEEELLVGMIV
jgi:hypothetical protein